MTLLAAAGLALAVWLWWGDRPLSRLRTPVPPDRRPARVRDPVVVLAGVAAACLVGLAWDGVRGLALGAALGVAVAVAAWTGLHARRNRRRAAARAEVARACAELASLLRAGYAPLPAVQLVAVESAVLAEAAAHQRVGVPLPSALRHSAGREGCEGLGALADAWRIAEETGASMTDCLDALADHLVQERSVARTVAAELAAPRLTGRLLGLLPLAGIGLGYAVGGDPVGYLLGSPAGLACLLAGVALAAGGVVWNERLADRATGAAR